MSGNRREPLAQMGDATNTVLILAGELLKKAENLLIMGLHPSEVIKGYELASTKSLAELECASTPPFERTLLPKGRAFH